MLSIKNWSDCRNELHSPGFSKARFDIKFQTVKIQLKHHQESVKNKANYIFINSVDLFHTQGK